MKKRWWSGVKDNKKIQPEWSGVKRQQDKPTGMEFQPINDYYNKWSFSVLLFFNFLLLFYIEVSK